MDILEFLNLPWQKILLGNGYNFVYDVNYLNFGAKIWAHNDIINVMMNYGIVGLLLYFYAFLQIMKGRRRYSRCDLQKASFILFVGIWFVNAMFNMNYTYFCSVLSLPIIWSAISLTTFDSSK